MNKLIGLLGFVAAYLSPGVIQAQVDLRDDGSTHSNIQYEFREHFVKQYKAAAAEFKFSGKTAADVASWRKSFLSELESKLGLDIIASQLEGYIPRVEKVDTEDAGSFVREHWIIWTEPTVPLPITVLLPKATGNKLPLVITPHGHGRNSLLYNGIYPYTGEKEEGKTLEQIEGRSVAVQAVKEGYIAIAPTTRAFGITRTETDKRDSNSFSCHTQLMQDLLVGRTPIGDRVWDMMRVIDWAIQNLPIDKTKIAITGNSGGGTVSLFAAACDERVTVAAPSSAFSSFEASIGSVPHCACNYIPGLLEMGETGDVAGLIAPRPLCLITGVQDEIFPITGARVSFAHVQTIYRAAESPGNVMLYEGDGGHKYYPEGSWPFIRKYFKK
jgi:dienelactone hydrolase